MYSSAVANNPLLMSVARKVLGNTVVQVAGRLFMALLSVVIVKLITNYLGVEGYGNYAAIYEFLAFFGIATDLGLFTIGVREMAKADDQKGREKILANIITLRIILCLTVLAVAIGVAWVIPQYRGIHLGIVIASAAVFLGILQSSLASLLQYNLKMQYAALAQVMGKAAALGYMIYVVLYGFTNDPGAGFYHLILAGVIGNSVLVFVTFLAARRYGKIRLGKDWKYIRHVFVTCLPYGLALVLNMIYFRIGSIMLLLMQGPIEVGLYSVPMRILEILSLVPVFFMNSVLPVLTRHIKEATGRVTEILKYSFDFLFMAAVPMVIGAYVLAYPIIFLISSEEFLSRVSEGFYGSDLVLKILMFAMAIAFINSLFIYSIIATSHQNKLLWINGSCAVLNIGLNLFLIPEFGARGAAITTIFTEVLLFALAFTVARKYLNFAFEFGTIWKVLLAGSLMGLSVYFLRDYTFQYMQNMNVVVLVPIGAAVYGGVLLLTKGVSKDLLALVKR